MTLACTPSCASLSPRLCAQSSSLNLPKSKYICAGEKGPSAAELRTLTAPGGSGARVAAPFGITFGIGNAGALIAAEAGGGAMSAGLWTIGCCMEFSDEWDTGIAVRVRSAAGVIIANGCGFGATTCDD